ncbi:MAG: DUF2339 domain-containing protein [Raineya sp.]|jgi:hypothetical protein|nr:DUF2339 domain-containing protein [Raineya sp.]
MPTLACPYCQHHNDINASKCGKCYQNLIFTESQIGLKQIKSELDSLKIQIKLHYDELYARLDQAEKKLAFLKQKNALETTLKPLVEEKKVEIEKVAPIVKEQPIIQEIQQEKVEQKEEVTPIVEELLIIQDPKQNLPPKEEKTKEYKPKEQPKNTINQDNDSPSRTEEDLVWQEIGEFFTKTLMLGVIFAPFTPLFTYFIDLYNFYQKQDRLPAFFMTIGGIIALLFGFGYLMQFISDDTFEIIKIAGTCSFNAFLIFLGTYFHRKESKYHNFGSSLLGLSISLNLLLIYFLSYSQFFTIFASYPLLILALILLNNVIAFYLALRYDTRIILIISLFGGAFAPFYLGTNIISGYYFVYLWLLSAITVLIALKINWHKAGTVAFSVCTIIFAIVIFKKIYFENIPRINLTIALMAFAYLFYFFTLYKQKLATSGFQFQIKEKLEANDIFTLVANTSLLTINLFYAYQDQKVTLGYIYLFNALIFVISFLFLFKTFNPKIKFLWFTLVGTFLAFTIPLLFSINLTGLFWSLEGLALILLGFVFVLENVRKEGYLLLALGIINMFLLVPDIIPHWQLGFWTNGYRSLIGLGIVLIVCKVLLDRFKSISHDYEKFMAYVIMEVLTIWALLVIWIPLHFYLPVLSYNLMIFFIYGCLIWSYRYRLPASEAIAFLCLGFLLYGYFLSTQTTNTILFRFQTRLAQVAIIELFLSLWFFQFMYEKVLPKIQRIENPNLFTNTEEEQVFKSLPLQISQYFREIFFLYLPIPILSSAFRFYPDYILIAFSVSILITFITTEITKRIAVKIELHIFVVCSTIAFFLFDTPLMALSIGINLLVLGAIVLYSNGLRPYKGNQNDHKILFSEYRYFHAYTVYHFILLLSFGTFSVLHFSKLMGFFVFTIFLGTVVIFREQLIPIQSTYKLAHRLFTILGLGIVFFVFTSVSVPATESFKYNVSSIEIISLVLMLALFYGITYTKIYPMKREDIVWEFDLLLIHILTLGIYTSIVELFSNNTHSVWMTILITVHACILLFHSTSKTYKFSLQISIGLFLIALIKLYFIDMQNSTLQQKIITFMVIGVMMLVFPYLFMKYKEKSQKE